MVEGKNERFLLVLEVEEGGDGVGEVIHYGRESAE